MIREYTKNDELNFLDFLVRCPSKDFYLTENNVRIPITNFKQIRRLIASAQKVYIKEEKGDIAGVIIKWKSNSGEVKRDYIKLSAVTSRDAVDLLTYLLWNFNIDLYVKIDNTSHLKSALEEKKFRFFAGRGEQILMCRKPYHKTTENDYKHYKEKIKKFDKNEATI